MRPLASYPVLALALLLGCAQSRAADPSPTLTHIRQTQTLRCGINIEQAEYSTSDPHGNRQAFDADLCKAVAVAVLGKDAQFKTAFYPDDQSSMQALSNGEVDLIPSLTDDFTHSIGTHIQFTRPILWDSIGFLLPARSSVTTARQLSGKKICFLAETTVEESVRAWFAATHLSFVPYPFSEEGEMQAAFATGNDPALVTLLFQYGRYLMIGSSQNGGQPANLQGLWNDSNKPAWDSKYTDNINTEMNYWPVEETNLSSHQLPLFDAMKDLAKAGAVTAKEQSSSQSFSNFARCSS